MTQGGRLLPRWQWMALIVLGVVSVCVFIALVVSPKLNSLNDSAIRSRCDDRLTGDYLVTIARALAAPPAPNTERLAATNDLTRAAHRIANADRVCAHGVPKPLVPTPA